MKKFQLTNNENLKILVLALFIAFWSYAGWQSGKEGLVVFGLVLINILILGILIRRQIKLMNNLL